MDVSLRRQLVAALAASLTACGGGADTTVFSGSKVIDSSNTPQPPPPAPPTAARRSAPAAGSHAGPDDPIVTSYSTAASGVTPALEGGSIAHGGDGALWFSGGFVPNQIGRMTSAGVVSYPVTKAAGLTSFNPGPLARGPTATSGSPTRSQHRHRRHDRHRQRHHQRGERSTRRR
jgi:hypothetical protein